LTSQTLAGERFVAIAMAPRQAGRPITAIAGRPQTTARDWATREVGRRRSPALTFMHTQQLRSADGQRIVLSGVSLRLSRLALAWTLAVAAVAIAAASAWALTPKDGHYSGFVDPFKIGFTVANGKISDFVTDFEATTCPGLAPSSTSSSFEFPSVKIRNGQFSDSKTLHYKSGLDPHFTITGRFNKPTRAAGTLHEHIAVPANFGAPSCALSQPFSVTRVSK